MNEHNSGKVAIVAAIISTLGTVVAAIIGAQTSKTVEGIRVEIVTTKEALGDQDQVLQARLTALENRLADLLDGHQSLRQELARSGQVALDGRASLAPQPRPTASAWVRPPQAADAVEISELLENLGCDSVFTTEQKEMKLSQYTGKRVRGVFRAYDFEVAKNLISLASIEEPKWGALGSLRDVKNFTWMKQETSYSFDCRVTNFCVKNQFFGPDGQPFKLNDCIPEQETGP